MFNNILSALKLVKHPDLLSPEQEETKKDFYARAALEMAKGNYELGLGRVGEARNKLIKTNPGMVANVSMKNWHIKANDAFVKGGIEQKMTFLLWTTLNPGEKALVETNSSEKAMYDAYMARKDREIAFPNLYSKFEHENSMQWSVFARELAQLRTASYRVKKVGNQMKVFPGGREGAAFKEHVDRMKLARKKKDS